MAMEIIQATRRIAAGKTLARGEMKDLMKQIMSGLADDIQVTALLTLLATRLPTADELTGAAEVMRSFALPVTSAARPLVDTCGTGGSGTGLFNISTASAFVAAAGGVKVAKHGNRAMSGKSGSADLLGRMGVDLSLGPEEIARCIDETGFGFMFAQSHHSAVRHVAKIRAGIGIKTIFNMLGPLTNPAGARRQLLGVPDPDWQKPMAEVLQNLGSERVLMVHCEGLDELGLNAASTLLEFRDGQMENYRLAPEDVGLKRQSHDSLIADSPEASLALVKKALGGRPGPAADIVALNAGAALYLADKANSFRLGVEMATDLIFSGQAEQKMSEFVDFTKLLAGIGK